MTYNKHSPNTHNATFVACGFTVRTALAVVVLICATMLRAQDPPKPKVAIFPLAGDTKAEVRDKVGFSLRSKLDRDGAYEVLDGYTMTEAVAGREVPVTLKSTLEEVRKLADDLDAEIFIWGELNNGMGGSMLKVKVFDILQPDPQPHEVTKLIAKATDLRFVSEEILQGLPGVRRFEHPNEEAVHHDATAEELWQSNPDLVENSGFDADGAWDFIYLDIKQPIKLEKRLPAPDEAIITDLDGNRVMAMRLSKTSAENNGLAVLSNAIPIEKNTRYRLSFRYKSDGPKLHVFVKGYTLFKNINGELVEREIYRRQVPPTAGTDGQWVTIVDELNPQQVAFPVLTLRVDLYAYLNPGLVMFDDVIIKAVGKQTRDAKDTAIDLPVTRPAGKNE